MMVLDVFDDESVALDIPDDIAQHFSLWDSTVVHGLAMVQINPTYHQGLFGYMNALGLNGAFIAHPMKRNHRTLMNLLECCFGS